MNSTSSFPQSISKPYTRTKVEKLKKTTHSFVKVKTEKLEVTKNIEISHKKPFKYVETTKHVKRSVNSALGDNYTPSTYKVNKKSYYSSSSGNANKLKIVSLSDARKKRQLQHNHSGVNLTHLNTTESDENVSFEIFSEPKTTRSKISLKGFRDSRNQHKMAKQKLGCEVKHSYSSSLFEYQ